MCAESCFYKTNNNDPTQIPSYKIQSTLGEMPGARLVDTSS